MSLSLHYRDQTFIVDQQGFIVGRNDDCHLILNDPLASRRHASFYVSGTKLLVEDLNSRNGVQVNGKTIRDVKELNDGDEVQIAEQIFVVGDAGARLRTDTLIRTPDGLKSTTFGVLGALANKALQLGQGEEGERILERLLDDILAQAESAQRSEKGPTVARETFEQSIAYALRLAEVTQKGKWVDYVFRLYRAQYELIDIDIVNELYGVLPKTKGASLVEFRQYLEQLSSELENYSPAERFVMSRLEGMEALL